MGLLDILASIPQAITEKSRADAFGTDWKQRLQAYQDKHQAAQTENAINTTNLREKQSDIAIKAKAYQSLHPEMSADDAEAAVRAENIGNESKLKGYQTQGAGQDITLNGNADVRAGLASSAAQAQAAREAQKFGATADLIRPEAQAKIAGLQASTGLAGASAAHMGAQTELTREEVARLKRGESLYPSPNAMAIGPVIQGMDAQGNAVQIDRRTGAPVQAGGGALRPKMSSTVENRVKSAQTVNQVGNDIIAELSDPATAATVGPIMGRASNLQDLIGNPPPEFSHLAGQIESYALANMGVHGMRSAQGAQIIASLLKAHHTPQSLIATINGLNGFSQHYMQNEGMGAGSNEQPGNPQPIPAAQNGGESAPGNIQTPANTGRIRRYNPATGSLE